MAADDVREVLRKHHPVMRSETGPFSGCRCGGVRLGEDVIAHVVAALMATVDRIALEAAEKARREGYEQGRRDFQFQPEGDNHHNAALCPYCTPGARADAADGGEGR